jgi:putative phosphoesterase
LIIAAVADTHGNTELIIQSLKKQEIDHFLFAGDYYKDGQIISRELGIPCNIVSGNCDFTNRDRQEEIVSLMNKNILLVHGHQYGVKRDLNRLYYRAQELAVDAVVFGHTHSSYCERIGDIWLVNPGSPNSPRLSAGGTYAIIEIDNAALNPSIIEIPHTR